MKNIKDVLALFILALFAVVMLILLFNGVKENTTIGQMLGQLGTLAGMAMGYYFGSSKGSSDKDAMIASTLTNKPTAP